MAHPAVHEQGYDSTRFGRKVRLLGQQGRGGIICGSQEVLLIEDIHQGQPCNPTPYIPQKPSAGCAAAARQIIGFEHVETPQLMYRNSLRFKREWQRSTIAAFSPER